jgi:hypothetical protein
MDLVKESRLPADIIGDFSAQTNEVDSRCYSPETTV